MPTRTGCSLLRQPDVLMFATPPAVREALVELGLRHGVKAIAYEKSLACSLGEARRDESFQGVLELFCRLLLAISRLLHSVDEDIALGKPKLFHHVVIG